MPYCPQDSPCTDTLEGPHVGKVIRLKGAPATVFGTVPRRKSNAESRTREYLTEAEIDRLIGAVRKRGRYGGRDAAMILVGYRHGLRVSELCALEWSQIDFAHQRIHVARLKNGLDSVHPLTGAELRALPQLRRDHPHAAFVFMSERGAPVSPEGFRKMLTRTAEEAGMDALKVHPHMLRHGCGYKLANQGIDTRTVQAYLGHSNIQHTTRYTALAANRFAGLFRD
jgi:type 1 fimbriae regulatory protein FimE